jgi:hypothetical protein
MKKPQVIAIAASIEITCWLGISGMLLSAATLAYLTLVY